jgi:hypothetical protein
MTDKVNEVLYLARTPDPIYWSAGWHKDGPLHAIASARENYGSSGDVYMVYKGAIGTTVNGMGGFTYPRDADEPKLDGIYDAAGNWLGETLAEVARDFAKDEVYFDHCLDAKTIEALKRYAKEAA